MVDPFLNVPWEKFPGQGPALGVKGAAYIARRFVEGKVMPEVLGLQGEPVQANPVAPLDLGPQKGNRAAIDLYPA
jgi:hypothetical protein